LVLGAPIPVVSSEWESVRFLIWLTSDPNLLTADTAVRVSEPITIE
jgi:hypothetical protein